jgi:hypothetical protein
MEVLMVLLAAALATVAAVGMLCLRVRNGIRWRKMIDTYADREIAQAREHLGRATIRGQLTVSLPTPFRENSA